MKKIFEKLFNFIPGEKTPALKEGESRTHPKYIGLASPEHSFSTDGEGNVFIHAGKSSGCCAESDNHEAVSVIEATYHNPHTSLIRWQ